MTAENNISFERVSFKDRLASMLAVDLRRMFTTPLFYLMVGISAVIPVLILVMTTMMAGSTTTDPTTGVETTIEAFKNVWQAIAQTTAESGSMDMSLTGMCNINMLYFLAAVLVCIFIADDFRSGYAKNLFTTRSPKNDYVISKTIVCTLGAAAMIFAFFIGAMLGGAISALPFTLEGVSAANVVMCVISKMLLTAVFVPIYTAVSVAAKQRLWLSMIGSFAVSMLLFTMIPMITPLDSTPLNLILCLAGGALFSIGLGFVSVTVLKKTNIL